MDIQQEIKNMFPGSKVSFYDYDKFRITTEKLNDDQIFFLRDSKYLERCSIVQEVNNSSQLISENYYRFLEYDLFYINGIIKYLGEHHDTIMHFIKYILKADNVKVDQSFITIRLFREKVPYSDLLAIKNKLEKYNLLVWDIKINNGYVKFEYKEKGELNESISRENCR